MCADLIKKLYKLTSIWLWLTLTGCQPQQESILPESGRNLVGLGSIISLLPGQTTVLLSDYFISPQLIDSAALAGTTLSRSATGDTLFIKGQPPTPYAALYFYSGDTAFAVPVKRSDKQPVAFRVDDPERKYRIVQIAGDLNQWNPRNGHLEYTDGAWQRTFWLPPGPYQYKLVLDGQWQLDPANPDSIDNNVGGYNSLKVVPDPLTDKPFVYTLGLSNNRLQLHTENTIGLLVFWQNQVLPSSMVELDGSQALIAIPRAASRQARSHLRIYAYNKQGAGNDLLIPLASGRPLLDPATLNRYDRQANILYFMMVDRFYNGDTTNDRPLRIPEVNPKADFFGGDIKGITQKIHSGYFDSLHINTIWLSPITQNPLGAWGLYPNPRTRFSAYHGYWPVSWNRVDFRFGNAADLQELVEVAHQHNMNVLLDFVANHVHQEHPIYQQHPDWATDLYLPDGSLNTERWDEYRLTTWFDVFLPTLDLTNPELVDMLTDSAVFWVKEYGIDGFRHDATKHVPHYFWRELTKKLKKEAVVPQQRPVFQIGETYGSHELIASYVNSGEMDAQFDFNVYDNALSCFARQNISFERLQTAVEQSFKYYGYHHVMGNISGNQDKPRFMAYAGGDLRFDEDSKLAGWTRPITVTRPEGYERLKMFMAFNLTIPGIPVIYYGDEIGMTGANDPDNRRMMRFAELQPDEQDVKATVARLAALRLQNLELTYGDFHWLLVDDDVLAYARSYFGQLTVVVFNKSPHAASLLLPLPAGFARDSFHDQLNTPVENTDGLLQVDIEPDSFMIIQNH